MHQFKLKIVYESEVESQAMIQVFRTSCSSLRLQHPLQERGFRTSPRRNEILFNKGAKNCYPGFSCRKISANFSSSCNKPKRDSNLLGQTFGAKFDSEFVLQPKDDQNVTLLSDLQRKWDLFYRFCRLHSAAGTVTGVISVSLLPLTSLGDLSPAFFVGMLKAVIPFAFVNIYVAALNQLTDVEIDKINKPYLVLASGEYTMGQGKAITSAFGFLCLAMGIMFQSPPLFIGVLVHFLLGTAYSLELPLLRWKTNPYLAALCIMGLIGFNMQLAVFCHIQKYVLGRPIVFSKSLVFTVIFCSVFAVVLAMFKDISDVDGDKAFGNQTFSVTHGKKTVFSLCISILLIAYGSAVGIGVSSPLLLSKLVTVIGHGTLASILWLRANSVNLDDNSSVESLFMFLWKMFRAEYVLIHFIR